LFKQLGETTTLWLTSAFLISLTVDTGRLTRCRWG
jgi:hypothetical protein